MFRLMVLIVAMMAAGIAHGETVGRVDGHQFRLSGGRGDFTLWADGRVVLHDTRDGSVSIAGVYAFGGDEGDYAVVLVAQGAAGGGCPLRFRALILGGRTMLSKPFGACGESREIAQVNGTLVVVTPRLDGQGDEVDTITPAGVTRRFTGN